MDHSWRPRPPIQGNICPTCSVFHFPFCPPRPSFYQNPRFQFQSHNDHFLPRPPFDPFLEYPGPTANHLHHRPLVGNAADGFGDQRPSPRTPSYDHGDVGFKRMRVDDRGSGLFMGENHVSSSRISLEDERRLKLIRDHGSILGGSPLGGANAVPGFNWDIEREGYMQENSVLNRKMDGEENGKIDELRGGRNDRTLKLGSNFEMNEFENPGMGYFDRKMTYFHLEAGFNPNKYREECGSDYGQPYMQSNRNEELGLSQYGQVENSLLNNGCITHPARRFSNVGPAQQSQDEGGIPYNRNTGDGYLSFSPKGDLKQPSLMSQSLHYSISEARTENYQDHNLHRIHPSDSMSMKEPHYSHPTNWQRISGLSPPYDEQRSSFTIDNRIFNDQLPQPYSMQHQMQRSDDFHSPGQLSDMRQSVGVNDPSPFGIQSAVGHQNFRVRSVYGQQGLNEEGGYTPVRTGTNVGPKASREFNVQPPLPASPPPPLPLEPPGHPYSKPLASSSSPKTSSSLFPIAVSSPANVPSSYAPVPEAQSVAQTYYSNKPHLHASTDFSTEEFQACQTSANKYLGESQPFLLRHLSSDKPKVVDASHIFKQPHRATRPDHIVIILRGLPGSGKSYLAKMLRDLEVENGGDAPRIHSMDDYFMTEVEKVEESEVSKSCGSVRGKKPVLKKVIEYCYEPEMEEAYRSSMLKAFKKTLDEGVFSLIIVDDRNLRVADFAQFWATAKRSGYEVYLLEATYKDPAGCAARNVHGFTQDGIQKMAGQWEQAPSLYLKLDIKSLVHGDDLEESGIQEVDMDTEDGDSAVGLSGSEERDLENVITSPVEYFSHDGLSKYDKRWDAEGGHQTEEVKELRSSKWSDDLLDEDDAQRTEGFKGNSSALSGLIQAYSKEGKSVRWGDKVGNTGFSIGAARKANALSLVIGPGAGYNLKSNPVPEEENLASVQNSGESKRQNIFQEQIRAEHESFRAVFDKRRHRIGGLNLEAE